MLTIIAKLYLRETMISFTEDFSNNQEAVELLQTYSHEGMDALLLVDCSTNDAQQEDTFHTIKAINRIIDIPLYVTGALKRFEDAKKYLYAGATKVFYPMEAKTSPGYSEALVRFGEDKIVLFSQDDFMVEDPSVNFHELRVQLENEGRLEPSTKTTIPFSDFKKDENGLISVIVQDYRTNQVLMQAYMNEEAYYKTLETGRMTYYSRSRQELWIKGLTSGHFQYVKSLHSDCDQDALLAKVFQVGNACHTGAYSCFYNEIFNKKESKKNPNDILTDTMNVIMDRKANPKQGSYTNYLFDKGVDKILKKVAEEAGEIIIAAKNPDKEEIKYEIADFLYHVMVLMADKDITLDEVMMELANR